MREVSSVAHLDTMEAGAEYCVKAQAHVEAINRSSSFSPTQCVRAQGESQLPSCPLLCSPQTSCPVCRGAVCPLGEVKRAQDFAGEDLPGVGARAAREGSGCLQGVLGPYSVSEKFCCFCHIQVTHPCGWLLPSSHLLALLWQL